MQDHQDFLELIDRPALMVKDGIIVHANQIAKNRMIQPGTPVEKLLGNHMKDYLSFTGGCLYLSVEYSYLPCGITITRQPDGDIFLLDRDLDHTHLQTLALAGQQLRQSLGNVMISAEALLSKIEKDPKNQELSGQLNRGLFQMLRIISNMADSERYALMPSSNLESTELASFLREVMRKVQATLETANVTIHYEGLTRAVFSLVDREQLERAIYNMISNAVKFSPAGSCVEVSAIRCENTVRISVEDAGDGVAPYVEGSLFHRYQREAAIEDSRFGLGLGMTLVRTAAATHNGTVLLDRNKGTRVTLTIAIQKTVPGGLRSPTMRISDYLGGRDNALVELSDVLPSSSYQDIF